ncbi:MAG: hypothetical protein PWP24_638, partial [Clostridiales bacterium]|nr:hypothetical protein [Clostridiales bacterium]
MRKTAKKIGSLTLALSLLVTQAAVHPSTIYAEEVPGIAVSANKNVDVALAVGNTSVDYSAFEEQLKEEIGNQMPGSNINIMAATSVDTATSSDFDWMQFDHSLSNGGAANDFIEPTGSQEGTDYDKLDRHIDLDTTSGTKLTFRGYGASGYSDFMLLENNQTTNKTFQFDIKEYFAADALYAMGFFFNSDLTYDTSAFTGANAIYDAYHADKLYLNGYLLAMEYNGQSTYGMYIYK